MKVRKQQCFLAVWKKVFGVHVEAEMIPGGKKKDFTVKKKTGEKTSKRLPRNEKSMRASGDCTAKTNLSEMPTDESDEESKEIALTQNSEPKQRQRMLKARCPAPAISLQLRKIVMNLWVI